MKRRMTALALAAAFALCLTSCGAQSGSGSTPEVEVEETGDQAAQEFLDSITPETAEAKGACGSDITWYYQDNVLVLKGTGEMSDYDQDTSWDGVISPWRSYEDGQIEDQISWVIVGDGITGIGKNAFYNCGGISRVTFPETLKTIKDMAFAQCENLKEVTLPASLERIEGSFHDGNAHGYVETATFLGDAPELDGNPFGSTEETLTIYYSGSGFEPYIQQFPGYNWVKQ